MERKREVAPRPAPRTIGLVWVCYFVTAILGGLLTRNLVISSDAAATAANLLAHSTLFRAGVAVGLFANTLYVALTALLFGLFVPVNRSVSLAAAFFGVVGCAVQIVATALQLAPLTILQGGGVLASAFTAAQRQAAALLCLQLYAQTFHVSFVLFALFDAALGLLVYRSRYVPRVFGVVFMLAGLCALTFLWPPLAISIRVVLLPLAGLAEVGLALWLLVKGVDVPRWRERAT